MAGELLLRVDGSVEIGTGHAMRCLALAQAWSRAGGVAVFAMASATSPLVARIQAEGFGVSRIAREPGGCEDAAETAALAHARGVAWLAVDGYHFDTAYQRVLADRGLPVLLVDDHGRAGHYHASLILDQNLAADPSLYRRRPVDSHLLLGPRFVLLRREFVEQSDRGREPAPTAGRVLITLGGSDPANATLRVVEALEQVEGEAFEAIVVVGGSNPHYDQILGAARRSSRRVRVERDVAEMPVLFAWADVAVAAGGTTCWELAFMGLPAITLSLSENQVAVAEAASRAGIAHDLGSADTCPAQRIAETLTDVLRSPERRRTMSERGRSLVDGRGAQRVVAAMRREELRLRPIRAEDRELLFEWANDPDVRRASFRSSPISWREHCEWFAKKLAATSCLHFLALDIFGEPVGQVRLEVEGERGEISLSVAAAQQGLGYAPVLIRAGVEALRVGTGVRTVDALVKEDNPRSVRVFEKAGFRVRGRRRVEGSSALHLVGFETTADASPPA